MKTAKLINGLLLFAAMNLGFPPSQGEAGELPPTTLLKSNRPVIVARFEGFGTNQAKIERAVARANEVLASDDFRAALLTATGWDQSADPAALRGGGGAEIYARLAGTEATRPVHFYAWRLPFGKFRKPVATCDAERRRIGLNFGKITRTEEQWVATVIHEWSHVAGFRHDGNRRQGNQHTVPYKVQSIVENLLAQPCAAPP